MAVSGIVAKFEGEEPYARAAPKPAPHSGLEPQRTASTEAPTHTGNASSIDRLKPVTPVCKPAPEASYPEAQQGIEGGAQTGEITSMAGPSDLRPVVALALEINRDQPATAPPVFMDVAPTELLIDGSYQRDLSDRGLRLIHRIVEGWDWRRFKPPVCAWTERGLVVIDGQHTAIAAATHGGLSTIPVMVVEAKEAKDQASAFVGHNRDRLALHPTQIHHGAVAAGEPEALKLERVVTAAGARIVRNPYGAKKYAVGDTIAVSTIDKLTRDWGDRRATELLRLLVDGGLGLITKEHIRAAEELLSSPQYTDEFDEADFPTAVRKAAATAEKDAKLFAADHATSFWRGLVHVWFRAVKKRRRG